MLEVRKLGSISDLAAKAAETFGDATALAHAHPSTDSLSYRQLATRVERGAAALHARGFDPGDRVLLFSDSGPEWVIARQHNPKRWNCRTRICWRISMRC